MNSYTLPGLNQYFNTWCQVLNVEYGVNQKTFSISCYYFYGKAAYWKDH